MFRSKTYPDKPLSIVTKHSILVGGDGVYIYSDKRIKNNIQTIDDNQALLDFRKLNPCTYSYVDQIKRGNSTVYGFIAQEVEEVLPQLVRTNEGGYKAVDYDKLVGLLIEAVKDQQSQIDELKSKLG